MALVTQNTFGTDCRLDRGGLLADVTEDQDAVVDLLGSTRAVLFDFDGPICDLFGAASTAHVADRVKQEARREWKGLDPSVETCDDSHGILRVLRGMYDGCSPAPTDLPLRLAEKIVAEFESLAGVTAKKAPHVVPLVDLLLELGIRLVIVSNNAEIPIQEYLEQHGMKSKFEMISGRDPYNANLMKPHPHCVERALDHLSLPPSSCLLIGDQLTDLTAAQKAGTLFLGYTQNEIRAKEMKHNGANAVVSSHLALITAAREFLARRRASAAPAR